MSITVPSPRGPCDDLISVRVGSDADTFVVALYGELDISTFAEVERALRRAEEGVAAEIVVDLSGLHFTDSTGVQLLVLADARFRALGKRLVLLRGTDPVHRVFEICGLGEVLPFAD